jgi:hypothetical protein
MNNIPNEILLEIIQYCDSKDTVLVCRKWYKLSLPTLYSYLDGSSYFQLHQLLRTILERPELGELLHSIRLPHPFHRYDAKSSDVRFHELFRKTQGRIYDGPHDLLEPLVHYTPNLQSATVNTVYMADLLSLMLVPTIQTVVVSCLMGSSEIPEKYFGVSSIKKLAITRCNVPAEEMLDIFKVPHELRDLTFYATVCIETRGLERAITPLKVSLEKLHIPESPVQTHRWDTIGPLKDFKKLRKLECWPEIMGEPRTWVLPENLEEIVVWVTDMGQVERILELVRDENMWALARVEIIFSYDELLEEIRSDQRLCREGVELVYSSWLSYAF